METKLIPIQLLLTLAVIFLCGIFFLLALPYLIQGVKMLLENGETEHLLAGVVRCLIV